MLRILVAGLLAVPTLLHLARHGVVLHGTGAVGMLLGALAIALAVLGPLVAGMRRPALGLAWALVLSFSIPLLPLVLRGVPIALERVAVHGALAGMLLGFDRSESAGRASVRAQFALWAWAAVSIGSALGACAWNLSGSPGWVGVALVDQAGDLLVTRSMIDPTHPLAVLGLRLEMLGLAAAAARVLRTDRGAPMVLLRAVAVALPLGLLVGWIELAAGSFYRGESFLARLGTGLSRNHRPLMDHNALGTAMVLLLPLAIAGFLRSMRRTGFELALGIAGLASAATLLVTSRSKAAFGGALAGLALAAVFALPGRGRLRGVALGFGAVAGFLLLALQAVPRDALGGFESSKLGGDLVRTLRADAAVEYLSENRLGPWIGATRMALDHPLAGVGLGNYPRELGDYRDTARELAFNPAVENAHSQPLQIAAEEGLLGLLAALLVCALAVVHLVRGLPDAEGDERAFGLAILGGLLGCYLNLQLGHSLLEPSVAHLFGIGLGAALGFRGGGATSSEPLGLAKTLFAAAVGLLALAPHPFREPRPILGQRLGLFPEAPRAETGRADRLIADRARWIVRWGEGPSMILEARDIQPVTDIGERVLTLEAHALDVEADPTRVEKPLGRMLDRRQGNPSTFLRLRAPAGVTEGDLVEIRASVDRVWFPSSAHATSRDVLGVRVFDPVFRE